MEDGFISIREASQYLGMKASSLYSMVEGKEIPHYRFGRLIKFTKAELDAWVQERRVDRVDLEKQTRKILDLAHNPNIDVDALVKKSFAENRRNRYTASHGNQNRVKGLGEEVSHGTL